MGSLPRLKVKTELNYRKGPTWKGCSQCNFAYHFKVRGIGDKDLNRIELRCKLIGEGESRRYRILPDHICDRFDGSKYNKRLGG